MKPYRIVLAVAIIFVGLGVMAAGVPKAAASPSNPTHTPKPPSPQITICHAHPADQWGSWEEITIDANGTVLTSQHNTQHDADIIPPFTWTDDDGAHNFAGKNWSAEGQAVYNNGCALPPPTVTPSATLERTATYTATLVPTATDTLVPTETSTTDPCQGNPQDCEPTATSKPSLTPTTDPCEENPQACETPEITNTPGCGDDCQEATPTPKPRRHPNTGGADFNLTMVALGGLITLAGSAVGFWGMRRRAD